MLENPCAWGTFVMNDQRLRDFALQAGQATPATFEAEDYATVGGGGVTVVADPQASNSESVRDTQVTSLGADTATDTLENIMVAPGTYRVYAVVRGVTSGGAGGGGGTGVVGTERAYPRAYWIPSNVAGAKRVRAYGVPDSSTPGGGEPWTVALASAGTIVAQADFANLTYDVADLGRVNVFRDDVLSVRLFGPVSQLGYPLLDRVVFTPTDAGQTWWIKITSIDGLWDGEVRDERQVLPGRRGEKSSQLFAGGKTVTIAGMVRAANLTGLRQGQRALQAAFSSLDAKPFFFRSWIDQRQLFLVAKKNQRLQMTEEQTTLRYERQFTVQIRADDPTAYSTELKSSTIQIGVPGAITITNMGTAETYPIITIQAGSQPLVNPVLNNETTGLSMIWQSLTVQPGDYLVVDMDASTIMLNNVSPLYSGFDVVNSDFWSLIGGEFDGANLVGGDNVISILPFSFSSDASASIQWRDAF